ncbi:MAG: hypothetical protein KDE27_04230, partial [Planctomycetes bacterium]|nr:hypothetical protein [Planctomycetota bacterium]
MTTTRPDSSSRFVPVSEHVRERASRARRADAWRRGELLWLLAITLVAAVLRFWRVEVWSVSAAEAATYRDATAVSGEGWSVLPSFVGLLFESGLLPRHGEGWLLLPFLFAATLAVP